MTVLVTGGAGFIGTHLVRSLVALGSQVVVLDNLRRGSRAGLPDGVHLIKGDVRDPDTVRDAMRGVHQVYHLAAQSNVLGAVTDGDYSFTTNVIGTYNVLIAARDEGVERMVFTSSREVYGEVELLPVNEDRTLRPKNAYGASKVTGEAYCSAFQSTYGLDVGVLRLANVYGPGDRDRVVTIWIDRAGHGLELELYGGEQVLDLVPIDLVVSALQRAAEISLAGQPVNVGSGAGTTLRELAARVQALSAVQVGVRLLPARAVEVTRFIADITRMQDLLGLAPPREPLVGLPSLTIPHVRSDSV